MDIPRDRLTIRFSRASGPGGQHVNKTSTRVEVRFVLAEADWIPAPTRTRLGLREANRINADGELMVTSERHRSQSANIDECLAKLAAMIEAASRPPKRRKPTKPSRAAKQRRLTAKKQHGQRKQQRAWHPGKE
jgi:ribosome-associated protein